MRLNIVSSKALKLLQNITSLGKINKLLLPLNEEFKRDEPYEYFAIKDYCPHVYEETISLLIELSIMLRRESEQLEKYGKSINNKVKYSNIAKYISNTKDISFSDALSKIIHSDRIDLQMKDKSGNIGYGYEIDRNCEFTEFAMINGKEKDGTEYQALVDIKKLCINAFMIGADNYYMM